ncbi:uncharacterized protein PADG_12155 [Paracoccidioides brasiliensis Pb18]|uniref:Uncharacterized protein n=1 Tax=Paracoccidioides brasiliensis (strain Pb18) TaxID=502780 RepID=C1GH94_PARBD|nr:uncharacterized protein PADG_06630 [Paracoccidioides brasiliensis Pb18]XP_010762292.1 uncharacterized protein PADG_12155 [Paracoccidioides brasiliensis Pb18]EEH50551.2 hypothetical protein PADG_06630 [Paracoccidioides brasiliensis Pb18]KGM91700.1 hypothetical protein PADG_12155 [Paracoccidioides brasiliensis Pb18]
MTLMKELASGSEGAGSKHDASSSWVPVDNKPEVYDFRAADGQDSSYQCDRWSCTHRTGSMGQAPQVPKSLYRGFQPKENATDLDATGFSHPPLEPKDLSDAHGVRREEFACTGGVALTVGSS